jgi:hypothetical protein
MDLYLSVYAIVGPQFCCRHVRGGQVSEEANCQGSRSDLLYYASTFGCRSSALAELAQQQQINNPNL